MACNIDIKKLKDNLTLDFNQRPSQNKRPIQLETPDVDKLALSTPEVAEFLSRKLPTVGPLPTFTRLQDSDDEKSSKLALALQWPETTPNNNNNDNNSNIKIKKEINENSNIASFSGDSSIPLPNQEQAKLERKRLRNRIAAHKCRQRKLERINKLQIIKDKRKNKISDLTKWNNILIDVNNKLNNILRKHREFGCDL